MLSEKKIQNQILRDFATRTDMRLWRASTGKAVPYSFIKQLYSVVWQRNFQKAIHMLETPPMLSFGINGQADLSGILEDGRRLEIEVKAPKGRQSEDQKVFQKVIERFGGVYILAKSSEDVGRII